MCCLFIISTAGALVVVTVKGVSPTPSPTQHLVAVLPPALMVFFSMNILDFKKKIISFEWRKSPTAVDSQPSFLGSRSFSKPGHTYAVDDKEIKFPKWGKPRGCSLNKAGWHRVEHRGLICPKGRRLFSPIKIPIFKLDLTAPPPPAASGTIASVHITVETAYYISQ